MSLVVRLGGSGTIQKFKSHYLGVGRFEKAGLSVGTRGGGGVVVAAAVVVVVKNQP